MNFSPSRLRLVSRTRLGELLDQPRELYADHLHAPLSSADAVAVGFTGSEPQPGAYLVIRRGGEREFFAWATTYLPHQIPLSRTIRVLPEGQLSLVEDAKKWPARGPLSFFAGMIAGECLAQTKSIAPFRTLSISSAQTCSSFVVARTRTLLGDAVSPSDLSRSIGLLEAIGAPRGITSSVLQPIWDAAVEALAEKNVSGKVNVIADVLRAAIQTRSLPTDRFSALCRALGLPERYTNFAMQGAEERLVSLNAFLAELDRVAPDRLHAFEFLAGYFALTVGNGGTSHLPLLEKQISKAPRVVIWLCALAGIAPHQYWDPQFATFATFIQRELSYPLDLADPPRCDTSLFEFHWLADVGVFDSLSRLPRASQRFALVEVFPGVVSAVPISTSAPQNPEPQESTNREVREIAAQLAAYAKHLYDITEPATSVATKSPDDRYTKFQKKRTTAVAKTPKRPGNLF